MFTKTQMALWIFLDFPFMKKYLTENGTLTVENQWVGKYNRSGHSQKNIHFVPASAVEEPKMTIGRRWQVGRILENDSGLKFK